MALEIHTFPLLESNFGIFLHDPVRGFTIAIDAPEAAGMEAALREKGWKLSTILVTHQHPDHIEGIVPLKAKYACDVYAPILGKGIIQGVDHWLQGGDRLKIHGLSFRIIDTPGHCEDHISYWLPDENLAFVGDVIFALGCGRVFGGAYRDMWNALEKLAQLPDETRLYFGHEYALGNAAFAAHVDADNADLIARIAAMRAGRARGEYYASTTMAEEKATNPFLRADKPALRKAMKLGADAPVVEVFTALREAKNRF